MSFSRVQDSHHPQFLQIWKLLETAFHPGERRSLASLKQVLQEEQMHLLVWGESVQAVAVLWKFGEFDFLEYLAVDPSLRGQGLGTTLMQALLASLDKPFLLEVQPGTDAPNQARIRFYQRLGLHLNNHTYFQPPYQRGGETFPLQIMSAPQLLNEADFMTYTLLIKNEVYEQWYEA